VVSGAVLQRLFSFAWLSSWVCQPISVLANPALLSVPGLPSASVELGPPSALLSAAPTTSCWPHPPVHAAEFGLTAVVNGKSCCLHRNRVLTTSPAGRPVWEPAACYAVLFTVGGPSPSR